VAASLPGREGPTVVLAADTEVVLDGRVCGKPSDDADAARTLRALSGREHHVVTAMHAVRIDAERQEAPEIATTRVTFRELDDATIRWYVATGEPADKAGAYAIQGRGAVLVARIEGSWTNVVGLPLERLPALLEAVGVSGVPPLRT
jgi:septum formation protein